MKHHRTRKPRLALVSSNVLLISRLKNAFASINVLLDSEGGLVVCSFLCKVYILFWVAEDCF